MVSFIFVFIRPDLLSLIYLVKRKRAGDSEPDHEDVCHTGINVSMVFDSAIDHESAYSTGSSGCWRRRLGVSVLSLVSDLRFHDCV